MDTADTNVSADNYVLSDNASIPQDIAQQERRDNAQQTTHTEHAQEHRHANQTMHTEHATQKYQQKKHATE